VGHAQTTPMTSCPDVAAPLRACRSLLLRMESSSSAATHRNSHTYGGGRRGGLARRGEVGRDSESIRRRNKAEPDPQLRVELPQHVIAEATFTDGPLSFLPRPFRASGQLPAPPAVYRPTAGLALLVLLLLALLMAPDRALAAQVLAVVVVRPQIGSSSAR
jgi:hypothetical protein